MPRRSESFDAIIHEEMQDIEIARGFLLTGMDDFDESVEEALIRTIKAMGLKEFSELAEDQLQNVSAFIRGDRKISNKKLDQYLAVFGLKTKIVVVKKDDEAA